MFDLTQIGVPPAQERQPIVRRSNVTTDEVNKVPETDEAREFRENHWTPDKFAQDGQVMAGEPDESYREHLKNTEWVD